MLAASDTFRAAAVDQLKKWTKNQKADFHQGSFEQDPASVAYSVCQKALKEQ